MSNVRDLTRSKVDALVTAVNALRYDLFHLSDGYGVHADATDSVTIADGYVDGYATSSSALINAIGTAYTAHLASVMGAVTSVGAHRTADLTNVLTAPTATNLASAITKSDDFKAKFNQHITNTTVHLFADNQNTILSSNNATEAGLVTLVNECKVKLNAHFARAFGSDAVTVILA